MGNSDITRSDNLYLQKELEALRSSVSSLQQLSLQSKSLPSTTTVPVIDNELLNKADTARLTLCNSLLNTLNDLGTIGTTIEQMDQKLMENCESLSSEFGKYYTGLGIDLRNSNTQLTWKDFDLKYFDPNCTVVYKGKEYPLDYYCYSVIMAEGEGWAIYKDYRNKKITKEQMLARYGAEIIVARTYIVNYMVRKGSNVINNNGGTAAGKEKWLDRNINKFANQSYGRTKEAPIYAAFALQAAMETSGQVLVSRDNKSSDPKIGNGLSIANGRFASTFQKSVRSSSGTTPAQVLRETYSHGQTKADLGYSQVLSIGDVSLTGTKVAKVNNVTSLSNASEIGIKTVNLQETSTTTPSIATLSNKTDEPVTSESIDVDDDSSSSSDYDYSSGSNRSSSESHKSGPRIKPAPTVVVPKKTQEVNTTPTPVGGSVQVDTKPTPVKELVKDTIEVNVVTTEPVKEPTIVKIENNTTVPKQPQIQTPTIKANNTYKPIKNYNTPAKSETVNKAIPDITTEPIIIEDEPFVEDTIIEEPIIEEPVIEEYVPEEPIIDDQIIDIEPPTTVVENKTDTRNIGGVVSTIVGVGALGAAGAYAVKKAKDAEDEEE